MKPGTLKFKYADIVAQGGRTVIPEDHPDHDPVYDVLRSLTWRRKGVGERDAATIARVVVEIKTGRFTEKERGEQKS